jgi:hypothetical protein
MAAWSPTPLMSLNALLVVHGWCPGTIASLGNAPVRSLLEREVAEINDPREHQPERTLGMIPPWPTAAARAY